MSNGTVPSALNGLSSSTESGSSTVHLKSFGLPRDLSLGGSLRGGRGGSATKKVFMPNLNAVRNKNT